MRVVINREQVARRLLILVRFDGPATHIHAIVGVVWITCVESRTVRKVQEAIVVLGAVRSPRLSRNQILGCLGHLKVDGDDTATLAPLVRMFVSIPWLESHTAITRLPISSGTTRHVDDNLITASIAGARRNRRQHDGDADDAQRRRKAGARKRHVKVNRQSMPRASGACLVYKTVTFATRAQVRMVEPRVHL